MKEDIRPLKTTLSCLRSQGYSFHGQTGQVTADSLTLGSEPGRKMRFVGDPAKPFSDFNAKQFVQVGILFGSLGNIFQESAYRQDPAQVSGCRRLL
jgi:hypothetical protein